MKAKLENNILNLILENEDEILGLILLIYIAKQTPSSSYPYDSRVLKYLDFIKKFNDLGIFKEVPNISIPR